MKTKIETTKAPKVIGPYSQAIMTKNFVFTSGQIHSMPDGKLLDGTIEEQTHQVMRNLEAILKAAGVSFADVVKTNMYITDMSFYKKINEVYKSYITEPYTAREAIAVKGLPLGARIEISMIAVK